MSSSSGPDSAMWDRRYAETDRLWSASPNAWVAATVGDWAPGRALDLGAGEGRHAVWLAERGWQVTAVDSSAVGLDRGRLGAAQAGVQVIWEVGDVRTWTPVDRATYDLVLVAYLHLESDVLERARDWLGCDGTLVVLGHALRNLTDGVGGPSDPRLLYTEDRLRQAAGDLHVEWLGEAIRHTPGGDAIDCGLVARRGSC